MGLKSTFKSTLKCTHLLVHLFVDHADDGRVVADGERDLEELGGAACDVVRSGAFSFAGLSWVFMWRVTSYVRVEV